MCKKLLALILFVLTVSALCLIAGGIAAQPHLSELYTDEAVMREIISARAPHDFSDVYSPMYKGIRFNGYDLFEDAEKGMLLYSLVEDEARAFDPQVEIVSFTGAKMLVSGDPITEEMIRGNGSIKALLYTDTEYALFDLRLTTLPVMEIARNPATIEARHKTTLRLFDNRAEAVNHNYASDARIWMRGNNSTFFPKKSYRLELTTESVGGSTRKNQVPLLGMRMDEDWILNAMYNDPEKIREVLSSNLWHDSCAGNNQWGAPNGVEYRFIEVFFDGSYHGVYALGYPMNAKQLAIGPQDHYYKKFDPYLSETAIDFDAPGKVDGYEYLGPDLVHPDWEPLKNYYRAVLDESATPQTLYAAADADNAVDLWLFLNLVQGIDHAHLYESNTVYNLYFAAKHTADGRAVMLYAPWDMDRTWGKNYDGEPDLPPDHNVIIDTSIVTRLLDMGDEAMLRRVQSRYAQLRAGLWSDEALTGRVRAYESAMYHSGAYARDYERWYANDESLSPTQSLDRFAGYVLDRLRCMDAFVEGLGE